MGGSYGPEMALVETGHFGLLESLGECHDAGIDHSQGEVAIAGL